MSCPVCGTSLDQADSQALILRAAAIILENEGTNEDWGPDLLGITNATIFLRYFADKIGGLE